MSEWWRRSKRLAEPGEVAPCVHTKELISMPTELEEVEGRMESLMRSLEAVESQLGNNSFEDHRGRRLNVVEFNATRQRLKQEKARILADYRDLKAKRAKLRQVENKVYGCRKCDEAGGLLLAAKSTIAALDEPTRADRELLILINDWLKRKGVVQ